MDTSETATAEAQTQGRSILQKYAIAIIIYFVFIDIFCCYLSVVGCTRGLSCFTWFGIGGTLVGLLHSYLKSRGAMTGRNREGWQVVLSLLVMMVVYPSYILFLIGDKSLSHAAYREDFIARAFLALTSGSIFLVLLHTFSHSQFFAGKVSDKASSIAETS